MNKTSVLEMHSDIRFVSADVHDVLVLERKFSELAMYSSPTYCSLFAFTVSFVLSYNLITTVGGAS
jgi:hypothetical protein